MLQPFLGFKTRRSPLPLLICPLWDFVVCLLLSLLMSGLGTLLKKLVTPRYFTFLADDLLLFREASCKQACIIEQILSKFCHESERKVNTSKSKLFVSENTFCSLAHLLGMKFDIPLTTDLGIDLGVPILHGHIRSKTYSFFN